MAHYTYENIVTAANLYYVEKLTQKEIADRMGSSRVAVTRMLKRADEEGFVQITVNRPLSDCLALGLKLERALGLRVARVVENGATPEDTFSNIGREGADLLSRYALPGARIGAAWSRTVSSILPFVRKPALPPLCVNELAGTYLDPSVPYGVSWKLAEKLGAQLETLPTPVLVQSAQAKAIMLMEKSIARALDNAARVNVALVGVGDCSKDSSLRKTGYMSDEQLAEIEGKGAVGDVLMRYFDAKGRQVPVSFGDRTVSLEFKRLKELPMVIGIAFGPGKVEAIRGAITGKIIHALVTDRATAEALLAKQPE
jgi:deoxyribonucleoside regulator